MSDEDVVDWRPTPQARPPLVPRRRASGAPPSPGLGVETSGAERHPARTATAALPRADLENLPVVEGFDVGAEPRPSRGLRRPADGRTGRIPGGDLAPRGSRAEDAEQAAALVIDLLDAIESLVVNGRRFPFSAAVMVNEDEALDYVDRARAALPEDVKQARAVVERQLEIAAGAQQGAREVVEGAHAEAARVVAEARGEAERVVAAAHAEGERVARTAADHASALVSAHGVTAAAEQRAGEIIAAAEAQAEAERAQADAYARDLLGELAEQIERALGQVQRGMEVLPTAVSEAPRRQRR